MKIQLNQFVKPILFVTIGVVLTLFLFKGCDNPQMQQVNLQPIKDTLISKYKQLDKKENMFKQLAKESEMKVEVLKKQKNQLAFNYSKLKDKIKVTVIHDTVILKEVVATCDSLNEMNNNIIYAKDTTIKAMNSLILLDGQKIDFLKTTLQIKDTELQSEIERTKFVQKELKKAKRKNILIGIVGAIGIGSAIFLSK